MSNNSNNKGFITLTVVFEAMSLNRDEGMGNIQSLHLLTRGNGKAYSYMSRQALTYAVRHVNIANGLWKENPVLRHGNVTQYLPAITAFEEVDLFGYMVTRKKNTYTRPAPITFTHAVSLEPYNSDISFYANPEMARRSEGDPNPYNRQEHKSLYKFSVVVDLNRIGKKDNGKDIIIQLDVNIWDNCKTLDGNKKNYSGVILELYHEKKSKRSEEDESTEDEGQKDDKSKKNMVLVKIIEDIEIKEEAKRERLNNFFDSIAHLGHQISASNEPLNPLFIAAAHLKYGSPIFHNYVELDENQEAKNKIDGKLFSKGLIHAKSILKDVTSERVTWSIIEGSGDLHLGISDRPSSHFKESPLGTINKVKNWLDSIYTEKK